MFGIDWNGVAVPSENDQPKAKPEPTQEDVKDSSNVADVLRCAATEIEVRGQARLVFLDPLSGVCTLGAIALACGFQEYELRNWIDEYELYVDDVDNPFDVVKHLPAVVWFQGYLYGRQMIEESDVACVANWSDMAHTPDVIKTLLQAADVWERENAGE